MADIPGSIVTIEEKTGQKRKLELRGPCLPRRGASWKGEQRLVTTWYAGNPFQATQQVLGAVELPSDWEGVWTTTRMYGCPSFFFAGAGAAGVAIIRASTMRDYVDDFARAGALLSVTWATGDGRSIVREGRIGPFEFPHERMDDIEWRITFVWTGRGGAQARVLSTRSEDSEANLRELQGTLTDLQSSIQGALISAANPRLPLSANTFTLGNLEALAAGPKNAVASLLRVVTSVSSRVNAIGNLVQSIANTPADLRSQLSDITTDLGGTMRRQTAVLSRLPPEVATLRPEKPSSVAQACLYFGTVARQTDRVSRSTTSIDTAIRRNHVASSSRTDRRDRATAADVITTYRTSAGDTFAMIAIRFYGDPERGGTIAIANNFPGYQVSPPVGFALVIPTLKSVNTNAKPSR